MKEDMESKFTKIKEMTVDQLMKYNKAELCNLITQLSKNDAASYYEKELHTAHADIDKLSEDCKVKDETIIELRSTLEKNTYEYTKTCNDLREKLHDNELAFDVIERNYKALEDGCIAQNEDLKKRIHDLDIERISFISQIEYLTKTESKYQRTIKHLKLWLLGLATFNITVLICWFLSEIGF